LDLCEAPNYRIFFENKINLERESNPGPCYAFYFRSVFVHHFLAILCTSLTNNVGLRFFCETSSSVAGLVEDRPHLNRLYRSLVNVDVMMNNVLWTGHYSIITTSSHENKPKLNSMKTKYSKLKYGE
ncbi:hypothetical protein L9F63_016140, partial [Diploptera punctata]